MDSHPLATAFADAVAERDLTRLGGHLTDDVRMRAVLPAGETDDAGRSAVLARFTEWFGEQDSIRLLTAVGEDVGATRVVVHYRLAFELAEGPHELTQTSVCSLTDGRIYAISMVCSGYRRIS
jgi:hypothetical protein